jgi:FixJ family two-component response regulator
MVMPGMGGPDLAEGMMQRNPALRVLFLSGYTEPTFLEHPLLRSGTPFLQKPFTAETFVRKVRETLAAPTA